MKDVIIDRVHSYHLDHSRRRTLPVGWRGEVPDAVADDLVELKRGRLQGADAVLPARAEADTGSDVPAKAKRAAKAKAETGPVMAPVADLLSHQDAAAEPATEDAASTDVAPAIDPVP